MTKIKYLQPEEKKELFDVIRKDKSRNAARNRAIFYLAEYCALRASEIGKIRLEYVRQEKEQIYCERLKGSQNNTLRIIDEDVSAALFYYYHKRLSMTSPSPYLFLSQRNFPISRKTLDHIMKEYCAGTSIPKEKQHFHVLKHTRAVELADEGLNIQDIQWWLGHKNINNTMIYTQFTTMQQQHVYEHLLRNRRKNERKAEN